MNENVYRRLMKDIMVLIEFMYCWKIVIRNIEVGFALNGNYKLTPLR